MRAFEKVVKKFLGEISKKRAHRRRRKSGQKPVHPRQKGSEHGQDCMLHNWLVEKEDV